MAPLPPRGGIGFSRRRPTTLVSVTSLRHLQRLLLLVIAGPMPPQISAMPAVTQFSLLEAHGGRVRHRTESALVLSAQ